MNFVALVHLAITLSVDVTEREAQAAVPHVVAPDTLSPLSAGMSNVCHLPEWLEICRYLFLEPGLQLSKAVNIRLQHFLPPDPVSC